MSALEDGGPAVALAASPLNEADVTTGRLVWVAFALGVASAVPGMVLGLFGVPLGIAASAVSVVALRRLIDTPPDRRRGEMLILLGLGFGVFQVVFTVVAFYNAG